MMKTNQRRGFVAKCRTASELRMSMVSVKSKTTELGDKCIYAKHTSFDKSNGHRGIANAKYGAKKFVRTRLRFNENQALRNIMKNSLEDYTEI